MLFFISVIYEYNLNNQMKKWKIINFKETKLYKKEIIYHSKYLIVISS